MIIFYRSCDSIRWFISSYKKDGISYILDYGAGKLRNSIYLSELGFKVYACDITDQINKIRSLKKSEELYCTIDEKFLVNYRLAFDLIISNYVLNIIKKDYARKEYIRNTYLNLKRSGYLLVEVRKRTKNTPDRCVTAYYQQELDDMILSERFKKVDELSFSKSIVGVYRKDGPLFIAYKKI
ncbi:class I SAM-dependent methyltransferase [Orenia marismortui]|uniref:Tellurite resistance protein TehB n=1 Tax=Orenia marismortui TaxID=46469 RepID=A0A4R8H0U2_9FIRM|nr:methyltransferase domain-containing protein [Orenia marismortui]TDX47987.1 tellurite resistance protein TehB [Orenia marismortui]